MGSFIHGISFFLQFKRRCLAKEAVLVPICSLISLPLNCRMPGTNSIQKNVSRAALYLFWSMTIIIQCVLVIECLLSRNLKFFMQFQGSRVDIHETVMGEEM